MSFLIYPTPKMMPMQGMIGMGGGATNFISKKESSFDSYSVYFGGTSSKSWIKGDDDSCWAAGTGDFSCECWLSIEGYSHYMNFVNTREAAGTSAGWTFSTESNDTLGWYSNGHTYSPAGLCVDDTWTHVLTTRESGTIRLIQDGVLKSSASNSQNFSNGLFTIGINCSGPDSSGAAGWYKGYMSNMRYIVGSVPSDYSTTSTTNGTTIFTVPDENLTSSSQGATSGHVKFLGLQDASSATTAAVACATISTGSHTSAVTVGHDGPF